MRNSTDFGHHRVLSKTGDYALRALLVLARRGVDRPLSAETLAELTGAPANYMGKTLHALARAGLVRGTRGPAGGFALVVAPHAITIARIADVFTEAPGVRRCLLGTGACDAAKPCDAHQRWMRVASATREPLTNTTLADLIAESARNGAITPQDHVRLFHFPRAAVGAR